MCLGNSFLITGWVLLEGAAEMLFCMEASSEGMHLGSTLEKEKGCAGSRIRQREES